MVFVVFIHQAPARAPQAPPVVHVLMHYPADFAQRLAGAVVLVDRLACPDFSLRRNSWPLQFDSLIVVVSLAVWRGHNGLIDRDPICLPKQTLQH